MSNSLAAHVGDLELPSDVENHLESASSRALEPECTPAHDLAILRAAIAEGTRRVSTLLGRRGGAPLPGDAALIGALVRLAVDRRDIVINGDTEASLDQSVYPPRGQVCVPGSLTVHGDLNLVAPLVVCGDLDVSGAITDCGPQSVIVVLGDVRCRALVTTGEVLIGGGLHASGFVWGHYNDNVLEVHGALQAPVVMSSDHAIEAESIEVAHRPPQSGAWGDDIFDMTEHLDAIAELVSEPTLITDGELDVHALAKLERPWNR